MHDVLGIERVFSPYGLTEATGVATVTRFGDSVETIAQTAGRAVPGVEVATLRPDGSDAGADEIGEICVRGYNTLVSYLDDGASLTDEQRLAAHRRPRRIRRRRQPAGHRQAEGHVHRRRVQRVSG